MIITWILTILSIAIGFFLGRISDKTKTIVQTIKDEAKIEDKVVGSIRKKKKVSEEEEVMSQHFAGLEDEDIL